MSIDHLPDASVWTLHVQKDDLAIVVRDNGIRKFVKNALDLPSTFVVIDGEVLPLVKAELEEAAPIADSQR